MSKELINTYSINDPYTLKPMYRDEFYEGITKGENADLLVEVINLFLFKTDGRIAFQLRSKTKNHNAGLLDKTIGGHITCGHTPLQTITQETLQELSAPAYVYDNIDTFGRQLSVLREHLNTVSLVLSIDTVDIQPIKVINGKDYKIRNRSHLSFGIYDGPIRFNDSEASGINYYSLEDVKSMLGKDDHMFTDDIAVYMNLYYDRLIEFRDRWLK